MFCSSRSGGVSLAPYDSLNLGDHVGDDPAHVAINRQRLALLWGARPVFMQQVHGTDVVCIDAIAETQSLQADACWSTQSGLACTIMVADCLPLLFYLRNARVVAAAHAGWRGLAAGVLQNTLNKLAEHGDLQDLRVWLGPCIGPQAFEVGPEVMQAFCASDPLAAGGFNKAAAAGKFKADLAWLARHVLRQYGLTDVQGNDSSVPWCTFSQQSAFFSHRRDGVSGRFAAGIALV